MIDLPLRSAAVRFGDQIVDQRCATAHVREPLSGPNLGFALHVARARQCLRSDWLTMPASVCVVILDPPIARTLNFFEQSAIFSALRAILTPHLLV